MIVINTHELVYCSTKGCQFYYMGMMHWYTGEELYQMDQSKKVLNNLSKLNKVSNVNT